MKLYFFGKTDCTPCKEKKPLVIELADLHHVPLVVWDLDAAGELGEYAREKAELYKVRAVPSVVVIGDNGQRLAGFTGGLINYTSLERTLAIYGPHRDQKSEEAAAESA